MALCLGAVLGPLMGLVLVPFAVLGAACALMSIVLACVQVQDTAPSPIVQTAKAKAHSPSTHDT